MSPGNTLHYSRELLGSIGITELPSALHEGQIKREPEDFIVQEIGTDGSCACNTPGTYAPPAPSRIYSAVVTKTNLSTSEAVHEIASALGCTPGQIGVAGRKDVRAVTSQFISLHGIGPELLAQRPSLPPSVLLSRIRPGKDILRTGDLKGNRFTVKVVARQPFDKDALENRLAELQRNGFPNFFGPQRFGPRLNNHVIGSLLLQGNFEEAGKALITHATPYESKSASEIRQRANEVWGDWKSITSLFETNPHAYRSELFLLSYLSTGKKAIDYWKKISPQARFYSNAFGSLIFNQALSALLDKGIPLPTFLPTISDTEEASHMYRDTLGLDIAPFFQGLSLVSPGLNRPWNIASAVHPKVISTTITPQEATVCFELPNGAYATVFLLHLFDLHDTVR